VDNLDTIYAEESASVANVFSVFSLFTSKLNVPILYATPGKHNLSLATRNATVVVYEINK